MQTDRLNPTAARLFRQMFPHTDPHRGTADQWHRLMRMAIDIQNDLVDAFKRHTPESRRWAKIADIAKAAAKNADHN